jgi:hypothetical protein
LAGRLSTYEVETPGVIATVTAEPDAQELFPTNATLRAHLLKYVTLELLGKVTMNAKALIPMLPELLIKKVFGVPFEIAVERATPVFVNVWVAEAKTIN